MMTSRISLLTVTTYCSAAVVGCAGGTRVYGRTFPCEASAMVSPVASRCAAHPARPAVDRCRVCDRPRCGVDAADYGARGCPSCAVVRTVQVAGTRELLVRAGLAGYIVALVGATFATQYARERGFSLLAPALVGLATSWACGAATGSSARPRRSAMAVASAMAVLSAALAFALTPGGQNPL